MAFQPYRFGVLPLGLRLWGLCLTCTVVPQLLRLYTTEKQLGGDKVMRFYFLASITINSTMAAQILWYGDREGAAEKRKASKPPGKLS